MGFFSFFGPFWHFYYQMYSFRHKIWVLWLFLYLKIIFENELKMHFRPLCNLSQSVSNLNRSSNRLCIFEATGFGVFTFPQNSIARYLHRNKFFKSVPFQWNEMFRGQKFNRSSNLPKNQRIFFPGRTRENLASKKRSNQKSSVRESK